MKLQLSAESNWKAGSLLLLLLCVSAANQAIAQTGAKCSEDLMKAHRIHIPHAEFYRSELPTEPAQLLCRSIYKIPGKHARVVESLLIKKFGMGKLVFQCCGWFPKRGKNGEFKRSHIMAGGADAHYSIHMASEETPETKQWDKIEYFYVTLEIYAI